MEIQNCIHSVTTGSGTDMWKSRLSADGNFYVHDLWILFYFKLTVLLRNPTIWLKVVPVKVISFVWRTCLDRIPSAVVLSHRSISVSNCSCQVCDVSINDTNHILLDCPFVAATLRRIFNWCNLPWQNICKVGEIICFVAIWGNCPKKKF